MERADEIARPRRCTTACPSRSRQISAAAAECFQHYAGWADKIHGETVPVKGTPSHYTLREPVGVVAAIVPWNARCADRVRCPALACATR
jgi:aldehyde dehydrogenase (NAD+)